MSYPKNGYGQRIYNPTAYYKAVSEDRYGFNNYQSGWNDGYSSGYGQGYSDACDDHNW